MGQSPFGCRWGGVQRWVATAELQELQVQEAMDSMVKSVDGENIWKMLGIVFRCSASCCEDSQASMQQVHQCIERCHAPLAQAQALVTSELEKFQVRNTPSRGLQALMLLFCKRLQAFVQNSWL